MSSRHDRRFALLFDEIEDETPAPEPEPEVNPLEGIRVEGNMLVEDSPSTVLDGENIIIGAGPESNDLSMESVGDIRVVARGTVTLFGQRVQLVNADVGYQLPSPNEVRPGTFVSVNGFGHLVPFGQGSNYLLGMVSEWSANGHAIVVTQGRIRSDTPLGAPVGSRFYLTTEGLLTHVVPSLSGTYFVEVGVVLDENSLFFRIGQGIQIG